ncbi:hypothetical protein [Candidatus Poriferisocius sp.]|uniref:hypothetical protein n=1 Tax=Candidatus Poriferisocius sp. TaxID=3101276 RepID=UPI003B527135
MIRLIHCKTRKRITVNPKNISFLWPGNDDGHTRITFVNGYEMWVDHLPEEIIAAMEANA